jgi:putative membrane protein
MVMTINARRVQMRRLDIAALGVMTILAVGCNRPAQNDVTPNNSVGTTGEADGTAAAGREVARGDVDFVRDATVANMAEVELGRMALEHSTNREVKRFAQMMVDDHTKAGGQLRQIAATHKITGPTELDGKHRDLRDKLMKLRGADFDRQYADAMIDGHQDVANALESRIDSAALAQWKKRMADRVGGRKAEEHESASGVVPEKSDDPVTMDLNQWAADTYPTVQAHLEAAKALQGTVEGRRSTS